MDLYLPSMNQISDGLVEEALVQIRLAMGDVHEQKAVISAQANIKETWVDLLAKAVVDDRDAPLYSGYNEATRKSEAKGLRDPTSSVVQVCLWTYQAESHVFHTLNHANRLKDTTKVKTLGPFGATLFEIINSA